MSGRPLQTSAILDTRRPSIRPSMKSAIKLGVVSALSLSFSACQVGDDAPITEIVSAPPIPMAPPPLTSISPKSEPLSLGFAGESPADIGRYLLARGAQAIALSPDGSSLAFRGTETGTPQLWVVPSLGGQARQLTFGNGVTFFEWTPDGQGLVFGADNNGNEQESYFEISLDGMAEREILPTSEGGYRVFGGFATGSTEDSSDTEGTGGVMYAFASTERNGLDFDIYLGDKNTGETKRIYEGKYGFYVAAVSNTAEHIVLSQSVGEDADNLYLLNSKTGAARILSQPTPRANHTDAGVVFSADETALYFATNKDTEFAALVKYDLETNEMETLFSSEADVDAVKLCGADKNALIWSTNIDGFSKLHGRDLKTGEDLAVPTLPEGVYTLSCGSATERVAIKIESWNTPGDILVWDMSSSELRKAYRSSLAGLTSQNFVKPISVKMLARDGVELQGLLYLPKASDGDIAPPVVFSVHGGPTAQSRPDFNGPIQYLVNRGIAVFASNVRGSTGFGRTYTTLDDKENRLHSVRDLVDMLAHLSDEGLVDGDRAAVRGGSYGGYAVNAVLAAYPDTFKAGVSLFGVADWVTALEIASPALKASDIIEYGDITDPKWREFYKENSPIKQADAIKVPVLFSHGEMDPRIDIAETETMVRTLRANNVEADFIRIPDEGHGWRKLSNQLFYYRYEAKFLEEKLKAAKVETPQTTETESEDVKTKVPSEPKPE